MLNEKNMPTKKKGASGSPTLSDQALMHFPSFKLGPGESSRSHSSDEFIKISEISDAVAKYRELLDGASI